MRFRSRARSLSLVAFAIVALGLTVNTRTAPRALAPGESPAVLGLRTLLYMCDLAFYLEYYTGQNGRYPVAADAAELRRLVGIATGPETTFSRGDHVPRDGWNTPMKILVPPDGKSYRIISAGSDRGFDEKSWKKRGESGDLREDAVLENGKLVKSWKSGLLSPALPQDLAAPRRDKVEKGRAERTMSDIRAIATAMESYAVDNNQYPTGSTWAELAKPLSPTYVRELPSQDAWGTPFQLESRDGLHYRIVSAGSDKTFDESGWSQRGETTDFSQDLVYQDGEFSRQWNTDAPVREREQTALDLGLAKINLLKTPNGFDIFRAQETVSVMLLIGQALESYARVNVHDDLRYPVGYSLEALIRILSERYNPFPEIRPLPAKDEWGTPWKIIMPSGGKTYRIVSAGADRTFDEKSWSQAGESADPKQDIVYEDGKFVRSFRPAL